MYPCGHPMVATDGNGLYRVARGHTRGDQRPEKRYTNEFWRECIKKSARELGPGHFEGARFDGADLVRANLHRAHAEYAPFEGARLDDAILLQADLRATSFTARRSHDGES